MGEWVWNGFDSSRATGDWGRSGSGREIRPFEGTPGR
jgi:hypothetical protein